MFKLAWLGLGLWLLAAAMPQWQLVRRRFGRAYARRGWNAALTAAVVCGVATLTCGAVLTWLM